MIGIPGSRQLTDKNFVHHIPGIGHCVHINLGKPQPISMMHRGSAVTKQLDRAVQRLHGFYLESRNDLIIRHTAGIHPIAVGLYPYNPTVLPTNSPVPLRRKQQSLFVRNGVLFRQGFFKVRQTALIALTEQLKGKGFGRTVHCCQVVMHHDFSHRQAFCPGIEPIALRRRLRHRLQDSLVCQSPLTAVFPTIQRDRIRFFLCNGQRFSVVVQKGDVKPALCIAGHKTFRQFGFIQFQHRPILALGYKTGGFQQDICKIGTVKAGNRPINGAGFGTDSLQTTGIFLVIWDFRADFCSAALPGLQRPLQPEGIGQINTARCPVVMQHIEIRAFALQFSVAIQFQREILRGSVGQKQCRFGIIRPITGYGCPTHQLNRRLIFAPNHLLKTVLFRSVRVHKYQVIHTRLGQFGKLHVGAQRLYQNLIGILFENSIKTGIGHPLIADDRRRRCRAIQNSVLIHDLSIEQTCRIFRSRRKTGLHRCGFGQNRYIGCRRAGDGIFPIKGQVICKTQQNGGALIHRLSALPIQNRNFQCFGAVRIFHRDPRRCKPIPAHQRNRCSGLIINRYFKPEIRLHQMFQFKINIVIALPVLGQYLRANQTCRLKSILHGAEQLFDGIYWFGVHRQNAQTEQQRCSGDPFSPFQREQPLTKVSSQFFLLSATLRILKRFHQI